MLNYVVKLNSYSLFNFSFPLKRKIHKSYFFQDNGTSAATKWLWGWGTWRVPSEDLPLLVGIFCGCALVLLLIVTVILWRCCVAPHRNKEYRKF